MAASSNQIPQFKNLPDLLKQSVERYKDLPYLGTRVGEGQWEYITYGDFGEQVDAFRAGLASLGVSAGDRVAVISDNRVEWAVGAHAVYGLGACYVPMYQKQNPKDWEYILRDSGAKVLLAANDKIAEANKPLIEALDTFEAIVSFEGGKDDANSYAALLEAGRANPVDAADPDPEDLCGFIYTSGTTGNPKGVMLTHANITSNVNAVQSLFPMNQSDRSLSFLPWAHSFGQTCELHCGTSLGCSAAIVDDVTRLIEYLAEVKPTLLFSVPRIFNRIYDGLNKKVAADSALRQKIFAAAMETAEQRRALTAEGKTSGWVDFKHGIFDKLVFSKVRDRLGGRMRYAFSGGAAISKEVAQFIDNVGITVYEGYGLSETSPIATANAPGAQMIGSVGKAIPGVDIIIDTDAVDGTLGKEGEILIKGPNVMKGYYNLDEQTADVLRDDGAFRTGDLGWKDDDGYVYITGRIKEQYKLENGKYVAPAPLEEQLKLSGFINQAMVFGDNKLFNTALVVPDVDALKGWASQNGLSGDVDALLGEDKVKALFKGELDKQAQSVFKGYERVKDFRLIAEEFTTENDMLTPTMKLKRRNVIKNYKSLLDEMYTD